MKKALILIAAVLLITGLFVACSADINSADETASVNFGDGAKALNYSTTPTDIPEVNTLIWWYKATKSDDSGAAGTKTEWTRIKPSGIGFATLTGFKIGSGWTFTIAGKEDAEQDTEPASGYTDCVYYGTNDSVALRRGSNTINISLTWVAPTSASVSFSNIVVYESEAFFDSSDTWEILEGESVKASGSFTAWTEKISTTTPIVAEVGSHTYTVKVYDNTGDSSVEIATQSVTIYAYPGSTITVTGSIDNLDVDGDVDINAVYNQLSVLKNGASEPEMMSLASFRDKVNAGIDGYSTATVTLINDVVLIDEWTPIGTSEHPFSGVFDGQGHTISNLKVNSTSGYAGLFGNVTGTAADAPHTSDIVWDSTSSTVKTNSYSEDKYTAVVKNLVIDGFEVTNTSGDYVGTVVGYGKDACFANLSVKNGTVNGNGKTGGVIGATGENVLLDCLSTESSVTVSATGHSVGGIIGGVNRGGSTPHLAVISNCTNRANVSTTDNSNGIAAGILGHGGSTSGLNVAVINCANYGEIKCLTRTAGIVAQAQKVKLILNCVNYGKVWNEAETGNNILGGIAGECDTNGLQIVACTNNGVVKGYANNGKIAGIIGSIQNANLIEGCVNNVIITNTKENGTYSDITAGAANVLVANEATYTVDGSVSGEMTSVTIVGGETTCTSIVIDNEAIKKVFVNINNFTGTITGLAGKTLYVSGANSTVTIPQETAVEKVTVSGANCTIINNGTIATIRFETAGNYSINNNGAINNTTDFAFTISSTVNGVNVTIANHGTIAASGLEGAYALYFSSGSTCVVNGNGTITGEQRLH